MDNKDIKKNNKILLKFWNFDNNFKHLGTKISRASSPASVIENHDDQDSRIIVDYIFVLSITDWLV